MLYEWVYNHIIRAVGSSAIGILDMFNNEIKDNSIITENEKRLKLQNELQAKTIKRIFILVNQFITTKIKLCNKNRTRNKKLIERLTFIQNDCKEFINEFEKRGI